MLPTWITTSYCMQPFLRVAQLSSAQLHQATTQSVLWKALSKGFHACSEYFQEMAERYIWLPSFLDNLTRITFFGVLTLLMFASTESIGQAIVMLSALLGFKLLIRPLKINWTSLDLCVSVFFLTAVIATGFSSYVHTSLIGLFKFGIFFLGYLNCRILFADRPSLLPYSLGYIVLLGVIQSGIGLYQYINHVQPLATWQDPSVNSEDQLTRIFGTLTPSNPNLLAGFLIPGFASALGLTFWQLNQKRPWVSALSIACAGLILVALVLTGSRGAYLSILLMTAVTFFYLGHLLWYEPDLKENHKLKGLWLLVFFGSIAAFFAAIFGISSLRNRFLSIFAMREDSSNSYRFNVWKSTWHLIQDNWLTGIGPGNNTFKLVYGIYMVPGYNALSAYSIFLEIWAEQGLLGILSFIFLWGVSKTRALIVFYSELPLATKLMTGLLLTGMAGSIAYGLFDTIWYRPSVNFLFWLLVAGLAIITEAPVVPAKKPRKKPNASRTK